MAEFSRGFLAGVILIIATIGRTYAYPAPQPRPSTRHEERVIYLSPSVQYHEDTSYRLNPDSYSRAEMERVLKRHSAGILSEMGGIWNDRLQGRNYLKVLRHNIAVTERALRRRASELERMILQRKHNRGEALQRFAQVEPFRDVLIRPAPREEASYPLRGYHPRMQNVDFYYREIRKCTAYLEAIEQWKKAHDKLRRKLDAFAELLQKGKQFLNPSVISPGNMAPGKAELIERISRTSAALSNALSEFAEKTVEIDRVLSENDVIGEELEHNLDFLSESPINSETEEDIDKVIDDYAD